MSKLYDLREIVDETGLSERTVRYYLSEVLDVPGGTPGRKSWYDRATLNRLRLAQQILLREYDPKAGEVKPTLREFRQWLEDLNDDEVRDMVEMPYRIRPKWRGDRPGESQTGRSRTGRPKTVRAEFRQSAPKDAEHSESFSDEGLHSMDSLQFNEEQLPYVARSIPEPDSSAAAAMQQAGKRGEQAKAGSLDHAQDYLKRVMGPGRQRKNKTLRWRSHRFGPDLEIRTRQPLTAEQTRQIELAGQLLQSLLGGKRT